MIQIWTNYCHYYLYYFIIIIIIIIIIIVSVSVVRSVTVLRTMQFLLKLLSTT